MSTNVGYISDLHLDHQEEPWEILEEINWQATFFRVDYLIIAGDLAGKNDVIKYLTYLGGMLKHVQIFYTPGNHEFYDFHIDTIHALSKTKLPKNVHFLHRSFYNDDARGITVMGAVGWIDGSWANPYDKRYYKERYNDFNYITGYNKLGMEYGKADCRSIERMLSIALPKRIVVTHFVPLMECIQLKYMGDQLNHCFANNWDALVKENDINLWVYGHSHNRDSRLIDWTVFGTNCLGYPHEGRPLRIDVVEI